MDLKWNVFYHNVNKQEITTLNIFDHWRFSEDVENNLKKIKDKDKFAEELRRDLQYYFWSKSEYEVIISPWCCSRNTRDAKIDIYTQVTNNWEIFLDYVWNSKQHREARKNRIKKSIVGREYAEETKKCPMCANCPDNCPIENEVII